MHEHDKHIDKAAQALSEAGAELMNAMVSRPAPETEDEHATALLAAIEHVWNAALIVTRLQRGQAPDLTERWRVRLAHEDEGDEAGATGRG